MSDWNPDDPALKAVKAPHEIAGILRWHRANVPSRKIMEMLHLPGTKLMAALAKATEQEKSADSKGLSIHEGFIQEEEQS